mgnify:FL=1|jgi:hypothetical protein
MSQPITNLGKDDLICIRETIAGTETDVLLRILCTPETNPYGNYYFVVREYATGTGAGESNFRYNNSNTEVNYENSLLDQFMTGEYSGRLSAETLACIATSSVICYNLAETASYTLARKIFALSNKELHGDYSNDESVDLGYFTNNTSRITKNKAGNAVYVWTRSPGSASTVCYVYTNGYLNTGSPTNGGSARPAFNLLSSCLVTTVANGDGSYNLITSTDIPARKAGFTASLGDTETRPEQVKVECDTVCGGTLSVAVCNNYNDETPTWESTTLGATHDFANQTKTADKWGVGVKIEAESESNIILYEPVALVLCEEAKEETA